MSDLDTATVPPEAEDDEAAPTVHVDHVDPADAFKPADNDEARRVYVFMQMAGSASEFGDGDAFARALRATAEFLRTGYAPEAPGKPSAAVLQLITQKD